MGSPARRDRGAITLDTNPTNTEFHQQEYL
jgi:hypothetical protein